MIDNDWRNARIEEAAKAIFYADPPSNPHGPSSDLVFGEPYTHSATKTARKHARAALAVFEKAHTPTDDERNALAVIVAYVEDDYQREHGTLNGSALATADAILAAGFRRTDVPEPSAECPQPCMHLSQEDAREGRTCAEHPCTCREPQGEPSQRCTYCGEDFPQPVSLHHTESECVQGEPSDTQVQAALGVWREYPGDHIERSSTDWNRDRMRAALRAAGAVR